MTPRRWLTAEEATRKFHIAREVLADLVATGAVESKRVETGWATRTRVSAEGLARALGKRSP